MNAPRSLVFSLLMAGSGVAALAQPPPPVASPEGWIVGEIRAFAFPPGKEAGGRRLEELKGRGWLECDGHTHAAADHPRLAALLGEASSAAAKTFRVPDLSAGASSLGGGPAVRYLIYAGPPAAAADNRPAASKPEAALTLPPGHKMSVEVRMEGRIRKSAAVIDKGTAASPSKGGTTLAAWIIDPPGCGQACTVPRSVDGDPAPGTIAMQPCPARTPCKWTFENTGSEPRHFAFRFQAATGGDRLEPQPLESSTVPTGPCVFVAWANLSRPEETSLEGAERTTLLVNVQSAEGACDPARLKWN